MVNRQPLGPDVEDGGDVLVHHAGWQLDLGGQDA